MIPSVDSVSPAETDDANPAAEKIFNQNQAFWWDAARIIEDDFTFPLHEPAPHPQKRNSGKKAETISADGRGYYIRSREAGDDLRDIALDATIRKCAGQGRKAGHSDPGLAIQIRKSDLMRKVRVQKISNLLVFLVDLSWSMAVTQRMRATKEAILSILVDAYQSRDRVALVTFQKDCSKIVIPPTHSVMLAERSMKDVPIGGKTPLAAGLSTAHELMLRERRMRADTNQLLIVLTDGAGNVPLTAGGDPMEDVRIAAERIAADGFRSLVINTEEITFGDGLANQLAKQLNAPCHLISNIKSDMLLNIVRSEK